MKTVVQFEVIGEEKIHCSACESRIGHALGRLPGVQDVQASAATQRVSVTIVTAQVTADEVRARLAQLGYQVA